MNLSKKYFLMDPHQSTNPLAHFLYLYPSSFILVISVFFPFVQVSFKARVKCFYLLTFLNNKSKTLNLLIKFEYYTFISSNYKN